MYNSRIMRYGILASVIAAFVMPAVAPALGILFLATPLAYHTMMSVVKPMLGIRWGEYFDFDLFATPSLEDSRSSSVRQATKPTMPSVAKGKKIGEPMLDLLVSRLRATGFVVTTDWEQSENLLKSLPAKYDHLKSDVSNVRGFVYNNVIHINPSFKTAETPIHEYTHLWAEVLRQKNPDEWKHIVELMKQETQLWNDIAKAYPHLEDDDEIADEVLATYSGRHGAELISKYYKEGDDPKESMKGIRSALEFFWKQVCKFFNVKYTDKDEIADRVLTDFLKGVNPSKFADKKKEKLSDKMPLNQINLRVHKPNNDMSINKEKKVLTGSEACQTIAVILASQKKDANGDYKYNSLIGAVGYFRDKDARGREIYTAFDNSTGDCWVENFKTKEGAAAWCDGLAPSAEEVRKSETISEILDTLLPHVNQDTIAKGYEEVFFRIDKGCAITYDIPADKSINRPSEICVLNPEKDRFNFDVPSFDIKNLRRLSEGELDSLKDCVKAAEKQNRLTPAYIREVISDEISSEEDVFSGVHFDGPYDSELKEIGLKHVSETYDEENNECILPDHEDAICYAYESSKFIIDGIGRNLEYEGRNIDEIILNPKSFESLSKNLSLPPYTKFDKNGELFLNMEFFDGYARDLNEHGLGTYDRTALYYPTIKEVENNKAMQDEIKRYTGREWSEESNNEKMFDIALKYGQASRMKCPQYRFDDAVKAIVERASSIDNRFTPEQREKIQLAAACNGEDMYSGNFRDVFYEKLWDAAKPELKANRVFESWQKDAHDELLDLSKGLEREERIGLKR